MSAGTQSENKAKLGLRVRYSKRPHPPESRISGTSPAVSASSMDFTGRFPVVRISRTEGLRALFEVIEPPGELWIQGRPDRVDALLNSLPERGLAIVGTRTPQARTRAFVRSILHDLRGAPLVIVSGQAVGIDADAVEAARSSSARDRSRQARLGHGLEEDARRPARSRLILARSS